MRARVRPSVRTLVLGIVLTVAALVVPDSGAPSTDMALVKVNRATSVDVGQDVVWILAVGSDARPGEDMTRTRGDALQLIGMNAATGSAVAIGIPRDSYVPIPGVGSDRVNAALYYGGPQLLADTVGDLVGVQPDYVFVTRFKMFQAMVDDIGGIDVRNPRFFSDTYLKPKGFEAGTIHIDGYGALAFSRIRKTLPAGDFDRSANQQIVLRGIQAKIHDRASVKGWIESGVLSAMRNMAVDGSPAELFRLARAVVNLNPRKFTTCVIQGGIGNVGGASVVIPYVEQARRLGDEARDDAELKGC